jgi:hypothetical protein
MARFILSVVLLAYIMECDVQIKVNFYLRFLRRFVELCA